jgi:hypothetical protein
MNGDEKVYDNNFFFFVQTCSTVSGVTTLVEKNMKAGGFYSFKVARFFSVLKEEGIFLLEQLSELDIDRLYFIYKKITETQLH